MALKQGLYGKAPSSTIDVDKFALKLKKDVVMDWDQSHLLPAIDRVDLRDPSANVFTFPSIALLEPSLPWLSRTTWLGTSGFLNADSADDNIDSTFEDDGFVELSRGFLGVLFVRC